MAQETKSLTQRDGKLDLPTANNNDEFGKVCSRAGYLESPGSSDTESTRFHECICGHLKIIKKMQTQKKISTLFFLVCLLWCCFLFVCSVCHPSVCSWAFEDMIQRVQFLKKFWQHLSCHFQLWNLPSCFLPGSLLSFSAAQLVHCLWKGSTQGKALFQHSLSLNSLPPTSNSQMQYQQFPVSPLIESSSSPFFLPTILFARYLIKSSILFYKPVENKVIN